MSNIFLHLSALLLILVPLYPKFPLLGVSGSFVSVRLEDLVIALVIGLYILKSSFSGFKEFLYPIPRAIILFLIIGSISTFSGVFLTKSAELSIALLHTFRRFEYMLLFLVGYHSIKNSDHLKYIVRIVLVVSILSAAYGLGQQFLGMPVISTTNSEFSKGLALSLGPGARINSTFAGHYDLAAFSIFPLLIIISLLSVETRHKWFLCIAWCVQYWVMLLSASRITFASFFFCAFLLILLLRKYRWIFPLAILALIGVIVSPQLRGRYLDFITNHLRVSLVQTVKAEESISKDANTVPDALKEPSVPEDRSFNIRLKAEWPRALRSFQKNPILGTGYSSVGLATDNDYLRILAETGILGLAAFLLVIIRFIKTTIPIAIAYRHTFVESIILAVACSLMGLLFTSVFIDIFVASKIAIFTWLILGITEKSKTFK